MHGRSSPAIPDCGLGFNLQCTRRSVTLEVGFCIAALKEVLSKGQPETFDALGGDWEQVG